MKEVRGLSEAAVDHIIKETQKVFKHSFGRMKAGVDECLSRSSVDLNECVSAKLNSLFASLNDPFHGLHSTFLQLSFYSDHLGCIVSSLSVINC